MDLSTSSNVLDYKAGSNVDAYCDTHGCDGSDYVGWLPTSTPYSFETLIDRVYSDYGRKISPYNFIMSDQDVTVYAVCLGDTHEYA